MKKIHVFFWGICLYSGVLFAQNNLDQKAAFDSVYFDTAVNLAKSNYVKALAISDSMFVHSNSPLFKLKSRMLTASIYEQLGQQEQSIKYALVANKIAVEIREYDWQAKIYGFLSTQYRNLGLTSEGRRVLNKGEQIIEKVKDTKKKYFYYGLVHQEMAYYELQDKNYVKAKEFINKSIAYFDRIKDSRNGLYYKATNEELLAKSDLGLGDLDSAERHLDQALLYLDQSTLSESVLRGSIFSGKARVFTKRKDYKNAVLYFEKAEVLAASSGFLSLKLEVYDELANYYKEVGDVEKQALYKQKFEALNQSSSKRSQSTLDRIFTNLNQNKEVLEYRQYFYVAVIGLLLFCVCIGVLFYKIKKKRDLLRFKNIIEELRLERQKTTGTSKSLVDDASINNASKEKITISKAWETKILKHLEIFELEEAYLDKHISASSLAAQLDTNTKYLSVILKTHRNSDFNNYIGSLRIQYIMSKMINHPEYKNYKISYLAEECGFSTHSKFTAVFKKHTGITPSVFLENLNNE